MFINENELSNKTDIFVRIIIYINLISLKSTYKHIFSLCIFLMLQAFAFAAEFNIEVQAKLYAEGKKIKGANVFIYNTRGELYKKITEAPHKITFSIPLDDDFIIYIQAGNYVPKIINFNTKIEGMAVEDFWGKHKFKTELLSKNESSTNITLHAIERIEWSLNALNFVHANIAMLHKYREDFDHCIKKKKYAQCTGLIYKNIDEFLHGEKSQMDDITPEIIKQKASQNKETLEQLILKRELIKAELEGTLLKVELLDDPEIKKNIQQNVDAINNLLSNLDNDILQAKKDYNQTIKVLAKYKDIDQKVYQLKSNFQKEIADLKIEIPVGEKITSDESDIDIDTNDNDTPGLVEDKKNVPSANTSAKENKPTKSNKNKKKGKNKKDKEETVKKEREKIVLTTVKSVGHEIKPEVKAQGEVQNIIKDLEKNHKPVSSRSFKLMGEKITVKKYETTQGTFEVLSDSAKKVQLLKNNVLITEDKVEKEQMDYYKKLARLQEVNIQYDKIKQIKSTPLESLIFRIQVGAVPEKSTRAYKNVAHIGPLAEDYIRGRYRYMVGEYKTVYEMEAALKEVKKIIHDAFPVAYYFSQRITTKQAYNLITEQL